MLKSAYYSKSENAKSYFSCFGSFGDICGQVERGEDFVELSNGDYSLKAVVSGDESGVFSRRDSFTNKTDKHMEIRRMKSRFVFEGGEYQVYTQFNTWQNESMGSWESLNTAISAQGVSSRTTQDAVPFLALWNCQASRGYAFHLLPVGSWEMRVCRIGSESKCTKIIVEIGFSDYNFAYSLAAGESLEAAEILFYEIDDKQNMNCEKLHKYMHKRAPRRKMPIIYNSWMSRFDDISFEGLCRQATLASDLGAEYFVIDAGWFGDGKAWSESVGDWVENKTGAMCGRMLEFADFVRAKGMRFGLWLEPERATPGAKALARHPDFYLPGDAEPEFFFLDFANPKAREWIIDVVCNLIDKYGIEFIKDDYNADLCYDKNHGAFLKYHQGYREYIAEIKKRYPHMYISCCGSGGERMELSNYLLFDSFWPSDNESPYTQLRIYDDTVLRMPPQGFERWIAIHSARENEEIYAPFEEYNNGKNERLIACADAVWHNVVGVQQSTLEGLMTAGPIGISCDLTKLSTQALTWLKKYIQTVKQSREFWISARASILANTESMTAIEYFDEGYNRIEINIFTKEPKQSCFYVYPKLSEDSDYIFEEKRLSGREISQNGLSIQTEVYKDNWRDMLRIKLEKCK